MTLRWLKVQGRSMWPLAAPWQVGVAAAVDPLQPGDLLAVVGDRPGCVVVHRLAAIDGDRLILRGDANGYDDAPVPRSAVVGRVCALRWRGVELHEPNNPLAKQGLAAGGRLWSGVAPRLRGVWRRLRGLRSRNTPDC